MKYLKSFTLDLKYKYFRSKVKYQKQLGILEPIKVKNRMTKLCNQYQVHAALCKTSDFPTLQRQ